jgi:predicted HAD superfamily Cof-like phosphohydrolase
MKTMINRCDRCGDPSTTICGKCQKVLDPRIDFVGDIAEFHQRFGLEYLGKPRLLPDDVQLFRFKFLHEELEEYRTAVDQGRNRLTPDIPQLQLSHDVTGDLEHSLDALVDLVYVAIGTAYLHGFDFREAWRRVHKANMVKVRARDASESKRGSTIDVIKPPGWRAPSHFDLVCDHAHLKEEP